MRSVSFAIGVAAMALSACADRPHLPSETTCYLEPSLTPEAAQAAIDSTHVWEASTNEGFRCVAFVYGERTGDTNGTIAFRIAPSLGEPGRESLADTYHVHDRVDALVTLAPETLALSVDLRAVFNHEIGHALNIYPIADGGHAVGGAPSVMRPLYPDQTPEPTQRDVDAFWGVWR